MGLDPELELSSRYKAYAYMSVSYANGRRFKNFYHGPLKLETLHIKDFESRLSNVNSLGYHKYGEMEHYMKYICNWDDS